MPHKIHGRVETGLASHRGQQGVGPLALDDLLDNLPSERLDGLIDRLEMQELVRRERCTEDRRVIYIELTKKAAALLKEMDEPVREQECKLIGHLTRTELKELNASASATSLVRLVMFQPPHPTNTAMTCRSNQVICISDCGEPPRGVHPGVGVRWVVVWGRAGVRCDATVACCVARLRDSVRI